VVYIGQSGMPYSALAGYSSRHVSAGRGPSGYLHCWDGNDIGGNVNIFAGAGLFQLQATGNDLARQQTIASTITILWSCLAWRLVDGRWINARLARDGLI